MRHTAWNIKMNLCLLAVLVSCGRKETADREKKAQGRHRTVLKDAVDKTTPSRKPGATEIKPAIRDPGPPKPVRMDPAALRPTVKKPGFPVVYKLARMPETENVKAWGIEPLGGVRFVTVLSGRNKNSPTYWFRLLLLEKSGADWKKTADVVVDHPLFSVKPGKGKVGVDLKVSDYDWDGKPEALLRYRFATGPDGDGEIRKVAIVNVDGPVPRIALKLVFSDNDPRFPTSQSAHFKLEDIDNDGRPELVVTTSLARKREVTIGSKGSTVKTGRVERHHIRTPYRWDHRTDTYVLAASRDKLPSSMDIRLHGLSKDVGMTVGNLATGKANDACMDPECMGVWGFPAISRDGLHIALLEEVPMWASWSPAPGFDTNHRGLVFELLRAKNGSLVRRVEIIDSAIRSEAYTLAQDRACLDEVSKTGQGDPRLCPEDPKLVEMAMDAAKDSIKKRVARAGRALWGMRFMPLLNLSASSKGVKKGSVRTIRLEHEKRGENLSARIIERPSGRVLAAHTFRTRHPNMFELKAYFCPRFMVAVIRLVAFDEPSDYEVQHAILRLPKGQTSAGPTRPR